MKNVITMIVGLMLVAGAASGAIAEEVTGNGLELTSPATYEDHTNKAESYAFIAVFYPVTVAITPLMALAIPHHSIEAADMAVEKITSEAGRFTTRVALAPLRAVAGILALPWFGTAWILNKATGSSF